MRAWSREMSGIAPLALLDEIAAHFDPRRRAALFDALERLGGQVFLTGADPAAFAELQGRAEMFEVSAETGVEPTASRGEGRGRSRGAKRRMTASGVAGVGRQHALVDAEDRRARDRICGRNRRRR